MTAARAAPREATRLEREPLSTPKDRARALARPSPMCHPMPYHDHLADPLHQSLAATPESGPECLRLTIAAVDRPMTSMTARSGTPESSKPIGARGRSLVLLSAAGAGIPSAPRKYRLIVLIGLLLILADLGFIGGLVFAVIVSARRLRPSQLARPGASASGRWAALIAAVTLLGLVVLGNARFLISAYEDGRPSLAQVAGTWTDSAAGGTATLRVFADGTFTATGLPPDTDSSTGHDVTVQALPADEHGTWQMTRGDGEWYVLFLLIRGPQVRFDIVPPIQPGHLLGASFTYIQGQFSLPTVWGFDRTSPDPEYRAG